jgi:hypothetical protein
MGVITILDNQVQGIPNPMFLVTKKNMILEKKVYPHYVGKTPKKIQRQ